MLDSGVAEDCGVEGMGRAKKLVWRWICREGGEVMVVVVSDVKKLSSSFRGCKAEMRYPSSGVCGRDGDGDELSESASSDGWEEGEEEEAASTGAG